MMKKLKMFSFIKVLIVVVFLFLFFFSIQYDNNCLYSDAGKRQKSINKSLKF